MCLEIRHESMGNQWEIHPIESIYGNIMEYHIFTNQINGNNGIYAPWISISSLSQIHVKNHGASPQTQPWLLGMKVNRAAEVCAGVRHGHQQSHLCHGIALKNHHVGKSIEKGHATSVCFFLSSFRNSDRVLSTSTLKFIARHHTVPLPHPPWAGRIDLWYPTSYKFQLLKCHKLN